MSLLPLLTADAPTGIGPRNVLISLLSEIQTYTNTQIQKYKYTDMLKYRSTEVQKYGWHTAILLPLLLAKFEC